MELMERQVGELAGRQASDSCRFKRSEHVDCIGRGVHGPSICNCVVSDSQRGDVCKRFWREAELVHIKPAAFCCPLMDMLFHQSAEESGFMAGGFGIEILPNDGKMVRRNFYRTRFKFCPFCGTKQLEAKS